MVAFWVSVALLAGSVAAACGDADNSVEGPGGYAGDLCHQTDGGFDCSSEPDGGVADGR